MSIKTINITKYYGTQLVLDNINININKGEVVGLLGPNGAGKSTLMKIITCFLPPTSGDAFVEDFDVAVSPEEIKKRVGYLPENNPLYLDMYIREYLEFIAGIHKLGSNSRRKVNEIVDITGLGPEQHKKIGTLSRGYRQRVGLAQAMIHDPEVLILDEPTSGLDPNQLLEIRNLIKEIGKQKTVLLSTHIMQEVEAICNRVIIINFGKIVADDLTANISSKQSQDIVTVEFSKPVQEKLLKGIPGVLNCVKINDTTWKLTAKPGEDIRPLINKMAVQNELTLLGLHKEEQRLEEVFQQLTRNVDGEK
ncbi:MAG: gliding motility-associated ABC transporter ATP-binding subunit GldA [Bacteroidetes bacterium]|nr:gliding motility-associated ABC transporter ATP-binding subunit GldA [Bacteroidota bacterium]